MGRHAGATWRRLSSGGKEFPNLNVGATSLGKAPHLFGEHGAHGEAATKDFVKIESVHEDCQTAFKIDPRSASKIAPLGRWLLARSERIGAGGEEEIGPGAFCAGRAQRRCLKRQLSLPVSTMSQWWVRRSSSAVVILASPKTDGHSPNAKFVVTITEVCS